MSGSTSRYELFPCLTGDSVVSCLISVTLMTQVGFELERSFDGKASNLVESCGKSAVKLVALVTRHFPGIPLLLLFSHLCHKFSIC